MHDYRVSNSISFENLNDFSVEISRMNIDYDTNFYVCDDHIHQECEIYINLTGDVSFMVENKIYPIKKGSVIITKPSEYHHCIYNGKCQHKHFWILIRCKKENELFEFLWNRERGCNNLIQLSEAQLKEVEKICNRLINEPSNTLKKTLDILTLISMLTKGEKNIGYELSTLHPEISLAIDYMHAHYTENITIKDIADFAHTSISTLERNFKNKLGQTPKSHLKSLRLAHSIELLNEGKSVSQACHESGFNDYSLFISLFKKIYGKTPKKYQKDML